jgi:hypothetical protein
MLVHRTNRVSPISLRSTKLWMIALLFMGGVRGSKSAQFTQGEYCNESCMHWTHRESWMALWCEHKRRFTREDLPNVCSKIRISRVEESSNISINITWICGGVSLIVSSPPTKRLHNVIQTPLHQVYHRRGWLYRPTSWVIPHYLPTCLRVG